MIKFYPAAASKKKRFEVYRMIAFRGLLIGLAIQVCSTAAFAQGTTLYGHGINAFNFNPNAQAAVLYSYANFSLQLPYGDDNTWSVVNPPVVVRTNGTGNTVSVPLDSGKQAGLPPGMTLSANGTLRGTPTATGTFEFVVEVLNTIWVNDDSTLASAQRGFLPVTITVAPPNITITGVSDTLTAGTYQSAYPSVTFTATGGTPQYIYTASGLPPGMSLDISSGVLSGTPTAAGTFAFQVKVYDQTTGNGAPHFGDSTFYLTVDPVPLTITASNDTMTYGGNLPSFKASYSGFVGPDNPSSLTTAPSFTTTAASSSPAGTYSITPYGAVDANYIISYDTGTLAIDPASLRIVASNDTVTYGRAAPTPSLSYIGFVNGDGLNSLTTGPLVGTNERISSPVGTYPVSVSGASDPNYNIIFVDGSITVEPAVLTVTAGNASMTYGGTVPALTPGYSGFVNGDGTSNLTTAASDSTLATSMSSVGTYPITAGGAIDPNYTISYIPGTLTVNPAALTVTANNETMTYGETLPAASLSYSGFVNGDGPGNLLGPNVAIMMRPGNPVGTYPIVVVGAVDANYNITYVSGTLTIDPAALTVTANNAGMTYGGAMPALSVSYSGFVNGDDASSLTSQGVATTMATSASAAGTYPITAGGAVDPNYAFTYLPGTLTIGPATITVTADNASMTYGGTVPALPVNYSGFVNGDNASSLATPATATTTATSASAAGTYQITASGAQDSNYTFTYVPGTLTIDPAMLSVSADSESKVYGTPDPNLNYTVNGLANGDNTGIFSGTLSRNPGENVGSYPITLGTLSAGSNYVLQFTGNELTITKAPQEITWRQKLLFGCNASTQYQLTATASSGLPVSYTTSNPAVATVAGDALTLVQPGTVMITASQPGDSNYLAAANVLDTGIDQSPSLVRQHWSDALFFDNTSDSFVQWQWYKNGNAIPGAVQPFYSESPSLNGIYYVIATETTGETIQTCPLTVPRGGAVADGISVYPNPAKGGTVVSVVCNYSTVALQGARLQVVDMQGKVWQQLANIQPAMQITMPAAGGIYILSLQLSNGQRATVNVLVND